jgi:rubredoxin
VTTYVCEVCEESFEAREPKDGRPGEAKLLWDDSEPQWVAVVCSACYLDCLEHEAWHRLGFLKDEWIN